MHNLVPNYEAMQKCSSTSASDYLILSNLSKFSPWQIAHGPLKTTQSNLDYCLL